MNMQTPKQSLRVSFSQVGTANTSMSSFRRYWYETVRNIIGYIMYADNSAEIQASFVETISSRYSLEPYGLVQPLQVREVLKTSRDHSEYNSVLDVVVTMVTVESVQLHQSGWALLVIKTKIYLWRYNGKVMLLYCITRYT